MLAYLRVEGQDCLYNIWSRLGREHLEELIHELRLYGRWLNLDDPWLNLSD